MAKFKPSKALKILQIMSILSSLSLATIDQILKLAFNDKRAKVRPNDLIDGLIRLVETPNANKKANEDVAIMHGAFREVISRH